MCRGSTPRESYNFLESNPISIAARIRLDFKAFFGALIWCSVDPSRA